MKQLISVVSAALALGVANVPALAAGSASSASSAGSAFSGSISESFERSSDSSSRPARTAQGDYRVEAVAAVEGRPQLVRLTLQGAVADERFDLLLPRPAAEGAGVAAVGQVVHAAPRPYGVEFARADTREAFFLALHDEWHRELASHPVVL